MGLAHLAAAGALAGAVTWLLTLGQLLVGRPWRYRKQFEPDAPDPGVGLSVVVPARDERDNLARCLPTLLEQNYDDFEVIVVNDRSTDGTGDLLESMEAQNLRVVHGEPRPDETWRGKTWAAHQGARRARHDWLLFLDADVQLNPGVLRGAVTEARRTPDRLYSLGPKIQPRSWLDKLLIPLFGLSIVTMFPPARVNDPEDPLAMAAGAFLLFHRDLYERVGGHRAVKGRVAEDLALARTAARAGGGVILHQSDDLVTEMYPSLRATVEGINKQLLEGLNDSPALLVLLQLLFVFSHLIPLAALPGWLPLAAWGRWPLAGLLILSHALGVVAHRETDQPWWGTLGTWPGMLLLFLLGWFTLYQYAVHGGPRWKGRRMRMEP